jgi:hypothetical protein
MYLILQVTQGRTATDAPQATGVSFKIPALASTGADAVEHPTDAFEPPKAFFLDGKF